MEQRVTAAYLHQSVYPNLDAADLLSDLNPRRTGKAYSLDCPQCHSSGAAYYYPGSSVLLCNRVQECSARLSIWDAVSLAGSYANGYDIARALCAGAGVDLPGGDDSDTPVSAHKLMRDYFRQQLAASPRATAYLQERRGLSSDDAKRLPLGYYPSVAEVSAKVAEVGMAMDSAISMGILPRKGSKQSEYKMNGRIVGFWDQPDGSYSLWGRSTELNESPKYFFSPGTSKDIPYGFRPRVNATVCVEGTMDKHSLDLVGIPGCATGGNAVNAAQAVYMAHKGVQEIIFLMDQGSAAHEGALRTIRNCERMGICCSFGVLTDEDDVDKLRQNGEAAKIRSLADNAINGGLYLARRIQQCAERGSGTATSEMLALRNLSTHLTNTSRAFYNKHLRSMSMALPSTEHELLIFAGRSAELGLPIDWIKEAVEKKYRVRLSLSDTNSDGKTH